MPSAAPRAHTQTVRLTEPQHVLARQRMAAEPGMSWQKLFVAVTNAYIRRELDVSTTGVVSMGDAPRESVPATVVPEEGAEGASALSYDDDPDAVDLADLLDEDGEDAADGLGEYPGRAYGSQEPPTIGTRELAGIAAERTGRRVHIPLLRQLVREQFPQESHPGPGTRYRWRLQDPAVEKIVQAIGAGALDEIRDRRLTEAVIR